MRPEISVEASRSPELIILMVLFARETEYKDPDFD